jgi:hypothetical protein
MLEDENDYVPDFSIPPLEGKRVFSTLGIEKGVVHLYKIISPSRPSSRIQNTNPRLKRLTTKLWSESMAQTKQ